MANTQNTYFCSCLGPSCKCTDNLDRDIVETLTETNMSAIDLAETVGVDVSMVRESLAGLMAQGRVKRVTNRLYTIS